MIGRDSIRELLNANEKVIILAEEHTMPVNKLLDYGKNISIPKPLAKVAILCESLNRKLNDQHYTLEEIIASDLNLESKYFCINLLKLGMSIFGTENALSKPKILVDECLNSNESLENKVKKIFIILEPIIEFLHKDLKKYEHLIGLIDDPENFTNISNIQSLSESILKEFAGMEERLRHGDHSMSEVIIAKNKQFDKCILVGCGADHIPGISTILEHEKIKPKVIICYENNGYGEDFLTYLDKNNIEFNEKLSISEPDESVEDQLAKEKINLCADCFFFIKKTEKNVSKFMSIFTTTKEEQEIKIAKKILNEILYNKPQTSNEDLLIIKKNKSLLILYDDLNELEKNNQFFKIKLQN